MNKFIILFGFKHVGKSTIGKLLAKKMQLSFWDLDQEIEKKFLIQHQQFLSVREIMQQYGNDFFIALEFQTLNTLLQQTPGVISLGGGTLMQKENHELTLKTIKIHITAPKDIVFERIMKTGRPAFFPSHLAEQEAFEQLWQERMPLYQKLADYTIVNDDSIENSLTMMVSKIII